MSPRSLAIFAVLGALFASGCGGGKQFQYDWGRAYMTAFEAQADLQRASAQEYAFELSGTEGVELRKQVEKSSTDEESGAAELID